MSTPLFLFLENLKNARKVCYGKPLLKILLMDGQASFSFFRKPEKRKKDLLWKTFIENSADGWAGLFSFLLENLKNARNVCYGKLLLKILLMDGQASFSFF